MKKNILSISFLTLAFCGSLVLLVACNKGKINTTEQKHQLITGNLNFDISVLPTNGEYDSIIAFDYLINMDSFVKSFDSKYDTGSITNVSLDACSLMLNDKTTVDNFRNFHTVSIGITSGTNGYIHRMAAFNDIVDTAAYELKIPTLYEPNLASYMRADSIHYLIYGNVRRPTGEAITGKATMQYTMTLSR